MNTTTIIDLTKYRIVEVYGRRLHMQDESGTQTTMTLPLCTMTLEVGKFHTLTFRTGSKILQLKGPEAVLIHLHLVALERQGKEVTKISP